MSMGGENLDQSMSTLPRTDGRSQRRERNRDKLLYACRAEFAIGNFRPTIAALAKTTGLSVRTVFQLFGSIDVLYREALDNTSTKACIIRLLFRDAPPSFADGERALRAIVFGKA